MYGIKIIEINQVKDCDVLIVAVAHLEFMQYHYKELRKLYSTGKPKVLIDVKGIYDKNKFEQDEFIYWRL